MRLMSTPAPREGHLPCRVATSSRLSQPSLLRYPIWLKRHFGIPELVYGDVSLDAYLTGRACGYPGLRNIISDMLRALQLTPTILMNFRCIELNTLHPYSPAQPHNSWPRGG